MLRSLLTGRSASRQRPSLHRGQGWLDRDGSAATARLSSLTRGSWSPPSYGSETPRRASGQGPSLYLHVGGRTSRCCVQAESRWTPARARQPPSELSLCNGKTLSSHSMPRLLTHQAQLGLPPAAWRGDSLASTLAFPMMPFKNTPCSKPGPEY